MGMNAAPRHRLYLDQPLTASAGIGLDRDQAHYLVNVLRLKAGARLLVFNGRDGEFEAEIAEATKKSATLNLARRSRPAEPLPDLMLVFAPVKRARIDFIAEKATELGVGVIQPVMTEYTSVARVNTDRLRANAVEAAEQTGRLTVPEVREPRPFAGLLEDWPGPHHIIFCDEEESSNKANAMVGRLKGLSGPVAIFIGPEGGFSPAERRMLNARDDAVSVSLGPNLLRADTAMVAALSIWQATAGDWRGSDGA